ncbi:MAG TPA: hypothetical protein DHU89_00095 [Flavobacteriales bacterium]|nr:hypothetical protein [Flavobacteriales bacterium]
MKLRKHILKFISILGLTALAGHFMLVSVAVAPYGWSQPDIYYVADRYVKPQFGQYWQLFAPMPQENSRLYYRYYSEGIWHDQISLDKEMNSLGSRLAQRVALRCAHYLAAETRKSTVVNSDETKSYRVVKASRSYHSAAFVCWKNAQKNHSVQPDSIELILERDLFPKAGYTQVKTIIDYYGPESVR